MSSIARTIRTLQAMAIDDNCKRMNKSTVIGFLGELLVRQKLQSEGVDVDHLGGQGGYDLSIWGDSVTIDVKTSRPQKFSGTDVVHWGWALKSKTKKRFITATHFVCVSLTKECKLREFHVIRASDLKEFPAAVGPFKGVEHTFHVCRSTQKLPARSPWRPVVLACDRARKKKTAVRVRKTGQLKRLLRS